MFHSRYIFFIFKKIHVTFAALFFLLYDESNYPTLMKYQYFFPHFL